MARFIESIEDTTDVIVGMRQSARIDFHHPREQALAVRLQRIPRGKLFRARGQFGVRRNDAELYLPGERLLADLVPALVELTLILGDPILWRVMRRMRGAGTVVQQPRLLRRERVLHPHPGDRLVGEITVEDVVGVADIRLDRFGALV